MLHDSGHLRAAPLDGLILSGATPDVGADVSSGLIIIVRILSLLLPKIGLHVIYASAVSRDKAVVDACVNDPLVYRGKVRARSGTEVINHINSGERVDVP